MRKRSSVEVGATSWTLSSSGRSPAGRSATMRLVAPASRASAAKRSQPYASRIDAYVIGFNGTSTRARVARRTSRQAPVRIPCASARSPARRITGPSASGSENGNPSSSKSAPPSTAASASAGVSGPHIR
jgi:hypothetical protein